MNEVQEWTIREYGHFQSDEILGHYESVGWANYAVRKEMLEKAYEGSLCVLAAYDGDKLIGIVRAVGDAASIVFIQDLVVLADYQRRGIGTRLMRNVIERYKDVYQMELLTDDTDAMRKFYVSLGFEEARERGCVSFMRVGQV